MRHVTAIVVAAGEGRRFSRQAIQGAGGIPPHIRKMIGSGKSKITKMLVRLKSKPILIYSLLALSSHAFIKDIIVVVNAKNSKSIIDEIRQYRIGKISQIVEGGKRRQDSVLNGLRALDTGADLVLIHDAVRPFIEKNTISSVIKAAKKSGAAIVGIPVKATIKKVTRNRSQVSRNFVVKKTIDRSNLWEIQTPQVFNKELLLKAYKKSGNIDVTDDAMLIEKLGKKVSVVLGSYNNIKITTPEDLILAEVFLKKSQSHKVSA